MLHHRSVFCPPRAPAAPLGDHQGSGRDRHDRGFGPSPRPRLAPWNDARDRSPPGRNGRRTPGPDALTSSLLNVSPILRACSFRYGSLPGNFDKTKHPQVPAFLLTLGGCFGDDIGSVVLDW